MRHRGGNAAEEASVAWRKRSQLFTDQRVSRLRGGILSFRDVWATSGDIFGCHDRGFPGGLDSKESAHNAGDLGSIPGSGRSP